MRMTEQNSVTENPRTRPIRSVAVIVPLTGLLPSVGPLQDLLASTRALERSDRVYLKLNVLALVILITSVVVGFAGYIVSF
jgi:hypothetical protein